MKKVLNSVLTGGLILAIGVGYLGNVFQLWGDYTFKLFFPGWWTFLLMIPMVYSFINDGANFFNLTVFAVGAVLFASYLIPSLDGKVFPIIAAVVLILIGLRIILSPLFQKHRRQKVTVEINSASTETPSPDENGDKYETSFSERCIDYTDRPFYGASLVTNFGAIKLDLSRAVINGDTVIDAQTHFGGIKIILPDNVAVKLEKHSFFGGVDNKHSTRASDVQHTVVIIADSNFGGIEIV